MIAYKPDWPNYRGDYMTRGYIEPGKEMGLTVHRPFQNNKEAVTAIQGLKEEGTVDHRIIPMETFVDYLNQRPRGKLEDYLKNLGKPKSRPTQ